MFCQIFWVVFGAFYLASQSNIKEVLVSLIQQTQFPCEIDKTPVYMWEIKIKNSTLKPICINNFRYWWKRGSCVLLFFIKGSPGETCLNSAFWRSVSSEPRFPFCWLCLGLLILSGVWCMLKNQTGQTTAGQRSFPACLHHRLLLSTTPSPTGRDDDLHCHRWRLFNCTIGEIIGVLMLLTY